jgi:hypothetical protein
MSHVNDDQLLLLSYGELGEADAAVAELHLAGCGTCRARLEGLERSRAALEWMDQKPGRRATRWIVGVALAAAAILAVILVRPGAERPGERAWLPPTQWSATAGYIAGGTSVVEIDAQLTRLEQERYYGLPD